MAETGRCEHAGCNCPAPDGDTFCSDHCREAHDQDMIEIACDCGHSGCG
jgi:hypothetical protein